MDFRLPQDLFPLHHLMREDTALRGGVTSDSAREKSMSALASIARTRLCCRDEEIYRQEDHAHGWYRVVDGALRRFTVLPNGQRRIVDFLVPGDFFGFAGGGEHHYFTVQAVVSGSIIACYSRQQIEQLAEADPLVARLIRQKAFDAIARLQDQIRILGRTRATQKVGSFLLEVASRYGLGSHETLVLPISRYDIADYLAISVETVSRAMTQLKVCGAIAFAGPRKIMILDPDALRDPEDDYPASLGRDSRSRRAFPMRGA